MKIIPVISFLGACAWASIAQSAIYDNIALYGKSKYSEDFTEFDYVNPNAPQGGKIVLPAYGTFDNFNPYIFKGVAASFVA